MPKTLPGKSLKKSLIKPLKKKRNPFAEVLKTRTGSHSGPHKNRELDIRKGRSRKPKHKKAPEDSGAF